MAELFNSQVEADLIGSILISPVQYKVGHCDEVVSPGDFYIERHKWVWQAIHNLIEADHAVDFVTVCDELERMGHLAECGGEAAISSFTANVATSLHANEYARIVRDYAVRRVLLANATQIAANVTDLKCMPGEVIEWAKEAIGVIEKANVVHDFPLHHCAEAYQLDEPEVWLVENLILEGTVGIIYADAGSKKSWAMLDLAVTLAGGASNWLDMPARQARILWVDCEMGHKRMRRRIREAMAGHLMTDVVDTIPFYYLAELQFDFRDLASINILRDKILEVKAQLVIIDALMDVCPGADENSVQEMLPALANLNLLAKEMNCAILLIHHANKNGGYRGTSALKGSVDLLLKIESKVKSPNIDFEIEKIRDVDAFEFHAHANFGPGQFWLVGCDKVIKPVLSKSQEYVLRYLRTNGPSQMVDIQEHADTCTANAARQAVFSLTSQKYVRRDDAGGSGKIAVYAITATAEKIFADILGPED